MSDFNKTQIGVPPMVDPNKTQLGAVAVDPNRTVMGSVMTAGAANYELTVTVKPVQCPVCKTFNPVGMIFCVDCGLIFEKALDGDAFGAPSVQLPVLVDADGREHVLRPGVQVVGRHADILVEDTRASRRHAQVTYGESGLLVEDLGSTNGTSVNGSRLGSGESRAVVHGDVLSIGGYEMTVSLPGEASKTQMAMAGKTSAMAAPPTIGEIVGELILPSGDMPLRKGVWSLGRREGNDFVISDPFVSGKHGEIEVTDDGVYLTDTGSTNGTVVNDAKLAVNQKTLLGADDVIKFGQIEVRIRFREGA